LDEADLLADEIAILAAPGKLVAAGSPVSLKRDLGEGYSIVVTFDHSDNSSRVELLAAIRDIAPHVYTSSPAPDQCSYHLKSKESAVVQQVLELLERDGKRYHASSYDILGTTIEDIFLELITNDAAEDARTSEDATEKEKTAVVAPATQDDDASTSSFNLPTGRKVSPFRQALTIFHKRVLIARRSWLSQLLTIGIAVAGCCIPLVFITGKSQSCEIRRQPLRPIPVVAPVAFQIQGGNATSNVLTYPPGLTEVLGPQANALFGTDNVSSSEAFVNQIRQNYKNMTLGGLSLNEDTNEALFAWEASPPGLNGLIMLNLASNVLLARTAVAETPQVLWTEFAALPGRAAGTLISLRWTIFFGIFMVSL
jgi:ATP-binding cassette, subfamily A (ABC1), member 3